MEQCCPCCHHTLANTSGECPHRHSWGTLPWWFYSWSIWQWWRTVAGLFLSTPLVWMGPVTGHHWTSSFQSCAGATAAPLSQALCQDRMLDTVLSHRENGLWQSYLWSTTLCWCENNRHSVGKSCFEFGAFPELAIREWCPSDSGQLQQPVLHSGRLCWVTLSNRIGVVSAFWLPLLSYHGFIKTWSYHMFRTRWTCSVIVTYRLPPHLLPLQNPVVPPKKLWVCLLFGASLTHISFV